MLEKEYYYLEQVKGDLQERTRRREAYGEVRDTEEEGLARGGYRVRMVQMPLLRSPETPTLLVG